MRLTALTAVLVFSAAARADMVDLTTVTLEGDNPFTFSEATLGQVSLEYSGNYHVEGIVTQWGSTSTIGLGELGIGSGIINVSWEHAITSIDIRVYDLDLSEFDDFSIAEGTTLSLVESNPFGPASPLNGLRLTGSGSDLPNAAENNYTLVRISGAAFTEFTIEFQRPGSSGGGHSIGFGDFVVPSPGATILLLAGGFVTSRRRN